MSNRRASISVRVNVKNPGQFFACCGLLELAHRLWPGAEGWFECGEFRIDARGGAAPSLEAILTKLKDTEIRSEDSNVEEALRPVQLAAFGLTLDWWRHTWGRKTALKLWAGQQTSAGIVRILRGALGRCISEPADQLFAIGEPLTGRFGVDPNAAWDARDTGFSPNEQNMEVATYPAVELLAAVGLQRCRPSEAEGGGFLYTTWAVPLMANLAPAAVAGVLVKGGAYRFRITRRGSYKGFHFATPLRS